MVAYYMNHEIENVESYEDACKKFTEMFGYIDAAEVFVEEEE